MPNLPLPPRATVVSRSGGADALQITFKSSFPPDSIAVYYRKVLNTGEWSLVNDDRAQDGTITLYAERSGPPLWITIKKDPDSNGTLMTMAGAMTMKPDTTKG